MAFIEKTLNFTVGGEGVYEGSYSYADVTLKTSGSKVNWTISMRCPANGSGKIPLTRIEFFIEGQEIYNRAWDNYGKGFPCLNGSSASGSITLDDPEADRISVAFRLGVNKSEEGTCQHKYSGTLTRTYYEPGCAPTLTITDVGNNTVKFSGTLGIDGINNPLEGATITYTIKPDASSSGSTTKSITLEDPKPGTTYTKYVNISENCSVRGDTECEFKYNVENADVGFKTVKFYKKPNNPGKPKLSESSYRNKRLTVKQDWGWEWPLATPGNTADHNRVKGYRVRLFVTNSEGQFTNNPIINYYTSNLASKELTDNDWAYDRTSTEYPMNMRAAHQDIKPGDKFKLSVQAYSTNGIGTKLLSSEITSDEYTAQNAGIVHVKVSSEWKEGQVYVKVGGEWKEAETVNVKVGNEWKEAQ